MRKQNFTTGCILFLAILTGIASGCRSAGSGYGWLTPKSKDAIATARTEEPEIVRDIRGQSAISNSYSSPDAYPVVAAQPLENPDRLLVDDFSSDQLESFPFAAPASYPPINPTASNPPINQPPVSPGQAPFVPANPRPAPESASFASQTPVPETTEASPWIVQPIEAPQHPAFGNFAAALPLPNDDPRDQPSWVTDDPWGVGNQAASKAVSIESAAKEEEERAERARLMELATSKRKDGTPDYLRPLDTWNGPFSSRERKETLEQEIIRQVAYVDQEPRRYDNFPVYDWEKEEQKAFDWSVLDPVNFFTKVRDWVGLGPDESKANAAMKKGRDILLSTPDLKDRKKCLEAAKEFTAAASRWPNSVLEEDALHLAGECYFFGEDYPRAMKSYQKLLIKYQHSKHIDNAVRRLFAMARYWENEDRRGVAFVNASEKSRPTFDTFGHCKKAYETIFTHDPNGPISDDAMMALATAFLAKGRYQGDSYYEQAAYYYGQLRENYPLSKHIAKAHEFELYARSNAYLGAEFDSKMLDEAEKLADVTLRQFASEIEGEDKEEILSLKENVVVKQAEREWTLGQYYDKKQYFGAARMYYEKLLDRYPQTVYAEQARARLEQIRDKPAKPEQFGFFKKMFKARGE